MTILVDMDDVLERLVDGWVAYVNERFGTDAKPSDIKSWDITMGFPTLTREQVYSAVYDDALWDYVKPMPGASEMLKRLIDDGHQVYIVTATGFETLRAKMEKVLFRYFPYLRWSQVIITEHKELIKGDILIDDGPHNLVAGEYHKILFSAGHNASLDALSIGAVRVNNWQEAYDEVVRYGKERYNENW